MSVPSPFDARSYAAGAQALKPNQFKLVSTYVRGDPSDTFTVAMSQVGGFGVGADIDATFTRDAVDVSSAVADAANLQLATDDTPGARTGTATILSALDEAPDVGRLYLLTFDVTAMASDASFEAGAGTPFGDLTSADLPDGVGVHKVLTRATVSSTTSVCRTNNNVTVARVLVQPAEWTYEVPTGAEGANLRASITQGERTLSRTATVPLSGFLYVSPTGSDTWGTGALTAPYRTPTAASSRAVAGDTVIFLPGTYGVFAVQTSGASGSPITYTTRSNEKRLAIFEGTFQDHLENDGPGVPAGAASEDGIRIFNRDYITIKDLTIRNVSRHLINVTNTVGEQHGNITIQGVKASHCGDAGFFIVGRRFNSPIPTDLVANMPTTDILIEGNDISHTNAPSDFNAFDEEETRRGGANEAITIGNGVQDVTVRGNWVHDTLQFGIDFKNGVLRGLIEGNWVWNFEKSGVYIDAGERSIEAVTVRDNYIWGGRVGINIARETDDDTHDVQRLEDVTVEGNQLFELTRAAITTFRHPKDNEDTGEFVDVKISNNTVWNANTSDGYADVTLGDWPSFTNASAGGGMEFTDNLIASDKAITIVDDWSGNTGFTVSGNFGFANGIGADPLFTDPRKAVVGFEDFAPTLTLPDLSLRAGTPVPSGVGAVTT